METRDGLAGFEVTNNKDFKDDFVYKMRDAAPS
jgi:hypothetical protein